MSENGLSLLGSSKDCLGVNRGSQPAPRQLLKKTKNQYVCTAPNNEWYASLKIDPKCTAAGIASEIVVKENML